MSLGSVVPRREGVCALTPGAVLGGGRDEGVSKNGYDGEMAGRGSRGAGGMASGSVDCARFRPGLACVGSRGLFPGISISVYQCQVCLSSMRLAFHVAEGRGKGAVTGPTRCL